MADVSADGFFCVFLCPDVPLQDPSALSSRTGYEWKSGKTGARGTLGGPPVGVRRSQAREKRNSWVI